MRYKYEGSIAWHRYADTGKVAHVGQFFKIADVSFELQESVDGLIEAAKIELTAAMIDNRLAMLVAAAFTACNKDFWTKIEANIKLGTDSQQVVGK